MNKMIELKEIMNWRYSTKKFDETKPVSEEKLQSILDITNLSASSYGLQPFKMIVVEDQALKKKLVDYSYGQTQIGNSSHLVVFAVRTDIDEAFIDNYVGHVAEQRGVSLESLEGYKKMLQGFVNKKDPVAVFKWASDQVYIALGTFMIACAAEEVDACPIGGFIPKDYDALLKLPEQNLRSVVVCVIGYRHEEDRYQHRAKVRKPLGEMVIRM
jgi:nitroreductase/dihydropteridine reductase